jgi:aspartate kinase
MNVRILKFGGTSVADAKAINRVINIVQEKPSDVVVVVSACSQITNKLFAIVDSIQNLDPAFYEVLEQIKNEHIELAEHLKASKQTFKFIQEEISEIKAICDELMIKRVIPSQQACQIIATGERLSSIIIADAMQQKIPSVKHIDANQLISTTTNSGNVVVDFDKTKTQIEQQLRPLLELHGCVIMAGFICADEHQKISNLGRGGSDYSASIVGNCLAAEAIEIWTDVDGILTSDPTTVTDTRLITQLSYQEAAELAYFGAKILHPKSIGPASRLKIPVYVKNTFNPDSPGTKIHQAIRTKDTIKSIASRAGITVVNIHSNHMYGAYGFLKRVFDVFDQLQCPVDVVTTSEVSVSITIDDVSQLESMLDELNTFAITHIKTNQAIVAVVGDGLKETSGISAKIFSALEDISISMISMGASEVNLTLVVDEFHHLEVINKLHRAFFSAQPKLHKVSM